MTSATTPRTQVGRLSWLAALRSTSAPRSPVTRVVLQHLAGWMDAEGGDCWPGMETIGDRAQVSPRTVKRHLQRAYEHGWVHRWYRTGRKRDGYAYQATVPDEVLAGLEPPAKPRAASSGSGRDAGPPPDPLQRDLLEPVKSDSESLLEPVKSDSEVSLKVTESPLSSNYELLTTHPHPQTPSPSPAAPADDDDDRFAVARRDGTAVPELVEAFARWPGLGRLAPAKRRKAEDQVERLATGEDAKSWTHPVSGVVVPTDRRREVFRAALRHLEKGTSGWPRGAVRYEVAAKWETLPGTEAAAVQDASPAPTVDEWIREHPGRHRELLERAAAAVIERYPAMARNRETSAFRGLCAEWVRNRILEELEPAGAGRESPRAEGGAM